MQFLMTDQTLRDIPEVITVEVEDGVLLCRDRWGAVLISFDRDEVLAFSEHLEFNEAFLSEMRERRDVRSGRRPQSPSL